MKTSNFKFRILAFALFAVAFLSSINAQTPPPQSPLTSDELVRMVRQIPSRPSMRDEIVEEIRRRGIGFPLTSGLLSVVATKSGNDALLRRTLEEAERRRLNPAAAALPSEAEGRELLEKARAATLAAAEAMPDFIVKQQIIRSYAPGTTKNWNVEDRLTVAVSFRASAGEEYKLLAINGVQTAAQDGDFRKLGGATSMGEYVSVLASLFRPESKAEFKAVDTDTLRGRRTVVYEYEIKRKNSRSTLTYRAGEFQASTTVAGSRGRIWVDRETARVLRLDSVSTEIPAGFPITASGTAIDYDWVTIAERQYLLPSRAVVEMTASERDRTMQSRNDIRFRNYQKYGTEIRIIEEDIAEEEPEKKP